MISVTQLINDKGRSAANQFIIKTEKGIIFQSYSSLIAMKRNGDDKIYLSPQWDFSKTTMKHLCIFLRDNTYYFNIKCKKDIEKNIKDGNFIEVEKLEL